MASGIYDRLKANLMAGSVNLEGDVIRVALMNDSHSFDQAHNTWSQVSGNDLPSGSGYTAGGASLAGKSITQSGTTVWTGSDVEWESSTFTAHHAVLYDDGLNDNDLICSFDFGGAQTVTGGTFTIQWNTNGIITLA